MHSPNLILMRLKRHLNLMRPKIPNINQPIIGTKDNLSFGMYNNTSNKSSINSTTNLSN